MTIFLLVPTPRTSLYQEQFLCDFFCFFVPMYTFIVLINLSPLKCKQNILQQLYTNPQTQRLAKEGQLNYSYIRALPFELHLSDLTYKRSFVAKKKLTSYHDNGFPD